MSHTELPYQHVAATPVGPPASRVQIHEHEAWTVSDWLGVPAVAVCTGIANRQCRDAVQLIHG
jgi:hypothetical protein